MVTKLPIIAAVLWALAVLPTTAADPALSHFAHLMAEAAVAKARSVVSIGSAHH